MLLSDRNRLSKMDKIKKKNVKSDANKLTKMSTIPDWIPDVAKPFVRKITNTFQNGKLSVGYIWDKTTKEIYGYKAFAHDMKCRDMQYTIGSTNTVAEFNGICSEALHFCLEAPHIFEFYDISISAKNRMCQVVIPIGSTISFSTNKCASNKLTVVREILDPEFSQLIDGFPIINYSHYGSCGFYVACKATYKNRKLHSYNFPAVYHCKFKYNVFGAWYINGIVGRKNKHKPYLMTTSKCFRYVEFYDGDDNITNVIKDSPEFEKLHKEFISPDDDDETDDDDTDDDDDDDDIQKFLYNV